jgi:hypothetical protein
MAHPQTRCGAADVEVTGLAYTRGLKNTHYPVNSFLRPNDAAPVRSPKLGLRLGVVSRLIDAPRAAIAPCGRMSFIVEKQIVPIVRSARQGIA